MEYIIQISLFLVQQQCYEVVIEAKIERPQFLESNIIIYELAFGHSGKAFILSKIHAYKGQHRVCSYAVNP